MSFSLLHFFSPESFPDLTISLHCIEMVQSVFIESKKGMFLVLLLTVLEEDRRCLSREARRRMSARCFDDANLGKQSVDEKVEDEQRCTPLLVQLLGRNIVNGAVRSVEEECALH
jgi:hypothetical protein